MSPGSGSSEAPGERKGVELIAGLPAGEALHADLLERLGRLRVLDDARADPVVLLKQPHVRPVRPEGGRELLRSGSAR